MVHRLPQPGGDNDTWGNILNDFLSVEHNANGSLKRGPDITDAQTQATSALQQVAVKQDASSLQHDVASFVGSGGELDSRLDARYATTINVKSYGAKGDGVTDDTAAIQAALNAVPANGAVVLFPTSAGDYLVSAAALHSGGAGTTHGALFPKANTVLVGSCSKIRLNNGTENVDVIYANAQANITLERISVDAGPRQKPYNTTCLQFISCPNLVFSNVEVQRGNIEGAYIYAATSFKLSQISAHDNGTYQDDASGVHLDTCTDGVVSDIVVYNNGFHGVITSTCQRVNFSNITTYQNGFQGLHVQTGTTNCTFTGVISYQNHRGAYIKDSGTDFNQFNGLRVLSNTWDGVLVADAYGSLFNGFNAFNNGEHGIYVSTPGSVAYVNGWQAGSNPNGDLIATGGATLHQSVDVAWQPANGQIPTWSDTDWQWEPQSIGDILSSASVSTTASNASSVVRLTRIGSTVYATLEPTASANGVVDWPTVPVGYRPSYTQYPKGVGGVMFWGTNGWGMVRANPLANGSDTNPTGWTLQKQDNGFDWSQNPVSQVVWRTEDAMPS